MSSVTLPDCPSLVSLEVPPVLLNDDPTDAEPTGPDAADAGWWSSQDRSGGWVEGAPSPFAIELFTDSAADHFAALAEMAERMERGAYL